MKVRILLQIAADDAEPGEAEELVSLEKRSDRLEQVGLSLAESKALLAAIQRRLVELQAEVWMKGHRHCEACGGGFASRATIRSPSTRSLAPSTWQASALIVVAART